MAKQNMEAFSGIAKVRRAENITVMIVTMVMENRTKLATMTTAAEAMAIAPAGQDGVTTIKNMGKNVEAEIATSHGTLMTRTGQDLTALTMMITIGVTKTIARKKRLFHQRKGVIGPSRRVEGNKRT